MPTFALTLVLLSALIHASWNVLLKRARDLESVSFGIFAGSAIVSAAIALVLPGPLFPSSKAFGWAMASGLFEGLYIVGLVRAMGAAPAGWAYGWSRGSAVLAVWPFSLLLFHEPLTPTSLLFAALVAAGLLGMGAGQGVRRGQGALPWAVASGCSIAAFNLCYKGALATGAQPPALFALSIALGSAVQAAEQHARGVRPTLRGLRAQPALYLFCTAGCVGGFLLYLFALRGTGAARVTTLRNTSVVFAQAFALMAGERPGWRGWAGACAIAAGALGLGWGH